MLRTIRAVARGEALFGPAYTEHVLGRPWVSPALVKAPKVQRLPDILTVEEAAEYLRCKPKRIYDLTSQRRLAFVKDGSRTLIRRDALDQYLADNQENAA